MLERAGFWLLLPIAAVQGLWLRHTAARLAGAPGERQGWFGEGPAFDLLAIGDSIIDGVGVDRIEDSFAVRFAAALAGKTGRRVHWRVEGKSGMDIAGLLALLDGMREPPPADTVLISIGVNDVTGMRSTKAWSRNVAGLLERHARLWPRARLLFAGLPPMDRFPLPPQPLRFCLGMRSSALDTAAARIIAAYPGGVHVPTRIDPRLHAFCEDGFHPSAETCTLWATELAAIESGSESR